MKTTLGVLLLAVCFLGAHSGTAQAKAGGAGNAGPAIPTILLHGLTGDAGKLAAMKAFIESKVPGVYVFNPNLGGAVDSVLIGINRQVEMLNEAIQNDTVVSKAPLVNMIGTSQGSIIMRGWIERYNKPAVRNFVAWVGPQGGIYGVPTLGNSTLNTILSKAIECCVYDKWVQDTISFASYWRDPYAVVEYLSDCAYLPDIDNAGTHINNLYRNNILSLKNFIMGYSEVDEIMKPKQTGWFSYFAPGTTQKLISLEESPLWTQDLVGLRTLNDTGRLHRFVSQCPHRDYSSSSCFIPLFTQVALPFLL